MYHQHFDLTRSPFSIAPDPHFLYMSERHREALAHLEWGLSGAGGFVLLTGEVGTGKTTLCRCLLERIPDDTDVAFVINPRVTVAELLTTICEELGDPPPEAEQDSVKKLVDRINRHLIDAHARNKRVVLVIDEAQNLSFDVLEQVRLLTNLETNERKLLQVILLGQPELLTMLEAPELRQLAQRVTARYHLLPLSRDELSALVHHRLAIAGARRNPFTADALAVLHRRAGGIPRIANVIADRALLGAYAGDSTEVTAPIVARAAREVLGAQPIARRIDRRFLMQGAALIALLAALGLGTWLNMGGPAQPASSTAAEQALPDLDFDGAQSAGLGLGPGPGPGPDQSPGTGPSPGTGLGTGLSARPPALAPVEAAPPTRNDARAATPNQPRADAAPTPSAFADLWTRAQGETERAAFAALLQSWFAPIPLTSQLPMCDQVSRAGLQCYRAQGPWNTLLELDRPAVLELWVAGRDEPRHVSLLALAGDRATVSLDGRQAVVSTSELKRAWRGRATVLWQMPPEYRGPSRRGDNDATSAWLAERLALLGGGRADGDGVFDGRLEQRLRSFQIEAGLRPDGIAGPRTWMRLNDRTDIGAPVLVGS